MAKSKTPTLNQRITALESHIQMISGGADSAAAGDLRALTFLLQPGGATKVELTLDFKELLVLGSAPVESSPRPNRTAVFLTMVIYGDSGQRATISVSNATPSPVVTAAVPTGASKVPDQRSIRTGW